MSGASLQEQMEIAAARLPAFGARWTLIQMADYACAIGAAIFFAPLFTVIFLALWVSGDGPIFFGHPRIGYRGQPFDCLKFRSMYVDAEARLHELLASDHSARAEWNSDHKLRRDPRISRVGWLLRKTSLDELPQFINVLRGDMNLIGPRPIVAAEIKKYGRRFQNYTSVKPGVTGLWQVSGRNHTTYRRRVALDTFYARRRSVVLNLKILIATIPAVLLARGTY